ncbi:MAG: ABC transporter permease [Clostridium sp.]|nr:ABC transporter permease [Clostridium sp.]
MKNTYQESDMKETIRRQRRALRRESFRKFCRRFCKNKGAVAGLGVLAVIILIAVLAPLVAPYGPFYNRFTPKSGPGAVNWLGTDELGRDVLSRIIYGSRVSLMVGLAASMLATVIGVIVGCAAGYANRSVSTLLLKTTETFQMLPMFFVAILLSAAFGPSLGLVVGVVGFMSWPSCARIVRGEFLSLREKEFVTAARSIGCRNMSIMFQEIFPSVIPQVIVNASMRMATAIMLEATLNFFGCGDPLRVSWGKMLNDSRTYLRSAPWASIFPGIAILITVLSINLVGDGLNDALNPKFRER